MTFNSLSRDHEALVQRLDADLIVEAFNSLSRDHRGGGELAFPTARHMLSTPSLGITQGYQVTVRTGKELLSTPSLGITATPRQTT